MRLEANTTAVADAYWAEFFGLEPDDLDQPDTRVVPHAGIGDYAGIFAWRRRQTLIISVPPDLQAGAAVQLAALPADAIDQPQLLSERADRLVTRIVGPAYVGYADVLTLRQRRSPNIRLLTADDAEALAELRDACPARDWSYGGSEPNGEPLAGAFEGRRLVALGGYERWGDQIAHLAVVTHPRARGRGYGAGVVSLAAEVALLRGLVLQYRTLHSNAPAMAIGRSLGFRHYADTIALRFEG